MSISSAEFSSEPSSLRGQKAVWKDDMEFSSQKHLNVVGSWIRDDPVGIGAQFWSYNDTIDTESRGSFTASKRIKGLCLRDNLCTYEREVLDLAAELHV
jgi:hypothetical protein